MKPVGLLRIVVLWLAPVAGIMTLAGCGKFFEKPAVTGFNATSGQLALLPWGYEGGETVFSADGRSVAIAAKTAGKVVVVHNAMTLGPYNAVRELQFKEGGSELAFIANKGGKEVVVADGIEGEPFDAVSALHYVAKSPVVYTGQLAEKMRVIVGKKASAQFDAAATTPIISFDGKQLAYVEYQAAAGKSRLQVCSSDLSRCSSGRQYDAISAFMSDATRSRFVFIAARDGKKTVVGVDLRQKGANETESSWYDDVASFNVAPNGGHLAFLARRGAASILVKDGLEIPVAGFDTSFELNVSNGGKVIYAALTGNKVRCFVDGKQVGKRYDSVDAPIFSEDGNHSLFVASEGAKYFIVVDGLAGPGFDMVVTPRFSPDGSRIVYRVRDKGERFVVVADLQGRTVSEHPRYEVVREVNFVPDGKTFGYGLKSGQQYRWQVEKL